MAQAIMREVWRARDGKEFATEKDALWHEECNALVDFLEGHPNLYFGREESSDPCAIAAAILGAYNLTPVTK